MYIYIYMFMLVYVYMSLCAHVCANLCMAACLFCVYVNTMCPCIHVSLSVCISLHCNIKDCCTATKNSTTNENVCQTGM